MTGTDDQTGDDPRVDDLERRLRTALPPEQAHHAAMIARVLARLDAGTLSSQHILDQLLREPESLLTSTERDTSLSGVLTIGAGSQIGDIVIDDIVGRDQVQFFLNIYEQARTSIPPEPPPMLAPPPDQPNRLSQALDQIRRGEGEMLLADLADAPPEGDGKRAHAALAAQLAETPDVPLAIRLQAADLAGQLRDPRIPVTVAQWQYEVERIPRQFGSQSWTQTAPPYWCYMPDGRYQIGGWGSSDTMALLELPPFWVARLAITAAQYAPFVARGYGADAEAWWEPLGWRWRLSERRTQPWEWDKALYNRSNQPVLGVTWHEATAYCRWLSAQLADMLPAGYIVRLPTEAEWEASASFDGTATRRRFPWGANPPTPDLAIYGQPRNGRPTPVGCFPAGAAACGALDLAGNIWELTTSRYAHYPERSQSAVKLSSNTHPSWRGGSWIDNESSLQCGSRGNHYVVFKSTVSYGFRIVLAPSLE